MHTLGRVSMEPRSKPDPLELEIKVIVSCLVWILGSHTQFSPRAASTPNLRAFSLMFWSVWDRTFLQSSGWLACLYLLSTGVTDANHHTQPKSCPHPQRKTHPFSWVIKWPYSQKVFKLQDSNPGSHACGQSYHWALFPASLTFIWCSLSRSSRQALNLGSSSLSLQSS